MKVMFFRDASLEKHIIKELIILGHTACFAGNDVLRSIQQEKPDILWWMYLGGAKNKVFTENNFSLLKKLKKNYITVFHDSHVPYGVPPFEGHSLFTIYRWAGMCEEFSIKEHLPLAGREHTPIVYDLRTEPIVMAIRNKDVGRRKSLREVIDSQLPNIKWVDDIPRNSYEDRWKILRYASAMVNIWTLDVGVPQRVFDAMALKVPVVSLPFEAMHRYFTPGVDYIETSDLSQGLCEVQNPQRFEDITTAALRKIRSDLNWGSFTKKILTSIGKV